MPKPQTIFSCAKCGAQAPKWQGRCAECGAWGTLQEESISRRDQQKAGPISFNKEKFVDLNQVGASAVARLQIGLEEIDRVLGGGIVPGSLILLGGEPGIGKSTLLLQIFEKLNQSILYVSGEESAEQIKIRLDRLGAQPAGLKFLPEINLEQIIAAIRQEKPSLVAIDSIQTIFSDEAESGPGNISQIRACTTKLLPIAKTLNIPMILIGHITKEGSVAGPKSLEHLVDAVMYLEGDRYHDLRILRTVKNRFGSTNEIGVFEMTQQGLIEVKNPNKFFLSHTTPQSGSAISCFIEGTRPFLTEIQALVSTTVFGYPQRKVSGYDTNRLQMLSAVLARRTKINLTNQDIHLNITGGIKVVEPAIDLAVCMAIISSKMDKIIDPKTIVLGEVGLGGELRNVTKLEQRLREAEKLNFTHAIIPNTTLKSNFSIKISKVRNLADAINLI